MIPRRERVVVTGGAGFVGSHLVDRLLADGRTDVVVYDNFVRGRLANLVQHQGSPQLTICHGDVRDPVALAGALAGATVVFHLAAMTPCQGVAEDAELTFESNVVGTFRLLRAAALTGVRCVVFTSSREVYGEPISLPVDEDHPLMAMDTYGASKTAGEVYCRAFRRVYGLNVTVLRLATVYGPRDAGRPLTLWLERAAAGQDLPVYGDKEIVDFLWIGQAVEALVRAAAVSGSLPPINVASGTGTKAVDAARRIARLADKHSQITLLPSEARVSRFVANVDRMRQMLRLDPPLDPLAHLPSLLTPSAEPPN
jgi:UDP-glucose 4-epimerase